MVALSEIIEDRGRLHSVIDPNRGRGMSWATSKERKLLGSAFAILMLPKFAPGIIKWAGKVYLETGQSPFFDNGFEYEYPQDDHVVVRRYPRLKIASLEPKTIEQELIVRRGGGIYKPVTHDDTRITKTGKIMRPKAHDEQTQLFNILCGQLGVVGLRTGKVEFIINILGNKDKEPYNTYLKQLRSGLLPGFIPVHVTCPDTRKVLLERRLWLETYYAESMASFTNDCLIVLHFIRHRDEILR